MKKTSVLAMIAASSLFWTGLVVFAFTSCSGCGSDEPAKTVVPCKCCECETCDCGEK